MTLHVPSTRVRLIWITWTVVLVVMPYCVGNIAAPAVPGQISLVPLSLAGALLCARFYLQARKTESSSWNRTIVALGAFATAVFALVELYGVLRGRSVLVSNAQIALNSALSIVETLSSAASFVGWGCALDMAGGGCTRSDNNRQRLSSFFFGVFVALCGAVFLVASDEGWILSVAAVGLVMVSLVISFATWRMTSTEVSSMDALLCITGYVFGRLSQIITVGVEPLYGFYTGGFQLWMLVVFGVILLGIAASAFHHASLVNYRKVRGADWVLTGEAAMSMTNRERVVLAAAVNGMTNATIASSTGLSLSSVATYRARAYKKLGVPDIEGVRALLRDGKLELCRIDGCPDGQHEKSAIGGVVRHRGTICALSVCAIFICRIIQEAGIQFPVFSIDPHLTGWLCALLFTALGMIGTSDCIEGEFCSSYGVLASERRSISAMAVAACACLLADPVSLFCLRGLFVGLGAIAAVFALGFDESVWNRVSSRFGLATVLSWAHRAAEAMFARVELCLLTALTMTLRTSVLASPELWPLFDLLCALALFGVLELAVREILAARTNKIIVDRKEGVVEQFLRQQGLGDLQIGVAMDAMQGLSIKESCEKRETTPNTVKSYRRRVYRRFGVKSSSELRDAVEKALIDA